MVCHGLTKNNAGHLPFPAGRGWRAATGGGTNTPDSTFAKRVILLSDKSTSNGIPLEWKAIKNLYKNREKYMKLHLLATALLLTFATGTLLAADKKEAAKWDINTPH